MSVGETTSSNARGQSQAYADVWHPKRGIRWGVIVRHAVLIFFCLSVLLPLFWVVLLSLKSLPDGYQRYVWPKNFMEPLFEHYDWVLTRRRDVIQNFKNSVLVTSGTVILSTVTAVLAGYALVHLRTPFRKFIVAALVASMFFPTRVTALIGIYNIQDSLGLINKTWSLMLPYTALSVAISIFVMRGVFETVPKEIVDSSRVDGASSVRTLLGIMLPLVRNGIVVVIIVNFVAAWGEYLLALTLMNDAARKTMPVFIANAGGGLGAWLWPRLAALYILAILPGLIAFAISQRWYMKGLQEGALKA
ncbi:MAG: multiple sugar transport system permease protein [Thermomicrobiales bacterium]|jgi:ABC-type glycerol-3-phosphate transport system permease component|nr:multiple sugar transport system permease protein [Thermomicrobiales bacterium]